MSTIEFLNNLSLFYPSKVALVIILSLYCSIIIGKFIVGFTLSTGSGVIPIIKLKENYKVSAVKVLYKLVILYFIFAILYFRSSDSIDDFNSHIIFNFINITFFTLISSLVIDQVKSIFHLIISLLIVGLFLSFILSFAHNTTISSNLYWHKMEKNLIKDPEEARKYYDKAIQLNPDVTDEINKAKILTNLKFYKEAKNELSKILNIEPTHLQALSKRAYLSIELGNYNDALKDIDDALAFIDKKLSADKSNRNLSSLVAENWYKSIYREMRPSLHFYRSKLLMQLGNYEEALNEIETTINTPFKCQSKWHGTCTSHINADAYYQKSLILSKLGLKLEAEAAEKIGKELKIYGRDGKYILPYNDLPPIDNND